MSDLPDDLRAALMSAAAERLSAADAPTDLMRVSIGVENERVVLRVGDEVAEMSADEADEVSATLGHKADDAGEGGFVLADVGAVRLRVPGEVARSMAADVRMFAVEIRNQGRLS